MTTHDATTTTADDTTATEPTDAARRTARTRLPEGEGSRSHDERSSDRSPEDRTDPTTDTPDANDADADEATGPDKIGNEAARYRRQLRDSQAEVQTLNARLERMQTREAETYADRLSQPSDLHTFGPALADLLDDDGDVDPDRVRQAVADIIAARPGLAKPVLRRGPSPSGAGATGARVGSSKGWGDVLRGT